MIPATKDSNSILWLAALGFALLFSAWTVLFVIAAHHRVPEVPLATPRES